MGVTVYPAKGGAFPQIQRTITSSGAVDLGTTRQVYMIMTGGGGGGGGGTTNSFGCGGGGGGAAGAVAGKVIFKDAYFIIGAGGTGGGNQANGTNGGNSGFVKRGFNGSAAGDFSTYGNAIVACGGGGGGGATVGAIPQQVVMGNATLTLAGIAGWRYMFGDSGSQGGPTSNTTATAPNFFPTTASWDANYAGFGQQGWTNNSGGFGTYSATSYTLAHITQTNYAPSSISIMDFPGAWFNPTSTTYNEQRLAFLAGTGTNSGGPSRGGSAATNGLGNNGRHGMFCAGGAGGSGYQSNTQAGNGGNTMFSESLTNTGGTATSWPGGGGGGGNGLVSAGSAGTAGASTTTGAGGPGGTGGVGGGGGGGGGAGGQSQSGAAGGNGGSGAAVLFW